jgi:hypothetical protein
MVWPTATAALFLPRREASLRYYYRYPQPIFTLPLSQKRQLGTYRDFAIGTGSRDSFLELRDALSGRTTSVPLSSVC